MKFYHTLPIVFIVFQIPKRLSEIWIVRVSEMNRHEQLLYYNNINTFFYYTYFVLKTVSLYLFENIYHI